MDKETLLAAADKVVDKMLGMTDDQVVEALENVEDDSIARAVFGNRLNVDRCGVIKKSREQCTGVPKFILSGILPNGEEICVCPKCYDKFLRKKNKKFNFVTELINERKTTQSSIGDDNPKQPN